MNNNQNIGRKPGDAMKIGAIIAVVVGSIVLIIGTLFSIITILIGSFANTTTVDLMIHRLFTLEHSFINSLSLF